MTGGGYVCQGGDEVGVDWVSSEVIHENDSQWHAWEES